MKWSEKFVCDCCDVNADTVVKVIGILQRSLTQECVGQCNTRAKKMARAIEKAIKELKE